MFNRRWLLTQFALAVGFACYAVPRLATAEGLFRRLFRQNTYGGPCRPCSSTVSAPVHHDGHLFTVAVTLVSPWEIGTVCDAETNLPEDAVFLMRVNGTGDVVDEWRMTGDRTTGDYEITLDAMAGCEDGDMFKARADFVQKTDDESDTTTVSH